MPPHHIHPPRATTPHTRWPAPTSNTTIQYSFKRTAEAVHTGRGGGADDKVEVGAAGRHSSVSSRSTPPACPGQSHCRSAGVAPLPLQLLLLLPHLAKHHHHRRLHRRRRRHRHPHRHPRHRQGIRTRGSPGQSVGRRGAKARGWGRGRGKRVTTTQSLTPNAMRAHRRACAKDRDSTKSSRRGEGHK